MAMPGFDETTWTELSVSLLIGHRASSLQRSFNILAIFLGVVGVYKHIQSFIPKSPKQVKGY